MAEVGFPGQHTTTTTVQSSTTVQTNIRYDPSYIRTLPGILKIVQMVLNLLGFICIIASGVFSSIGKGKFFNFVALFGLIVTGILFVFYLFHIIEKFFKLPWLQIELIYCAIMTLLNLIAASCAVSESAVEAYIAAGFFGFCAMVAYGFDTFLKFKAHKNGELAQGQRIVSRQTTAATTPTQHY